MIISQIKIENVLGHQELEFKPGKVNVIRGRNASGKTSILEAIKSTLKGASAKEAKLLRNGADHGESVLILDNGIQVKKTFSKDGSKLKIAGESAPTSLLNQIADAVSINPAQFLFAKEDQQLELLLETINLEFTPDEIKEAIGSEVDINLSLNELENLRDSIYKNRTGTNRLLDDKKSTFKEISSTYIPVSASEANPEAILDQIQQIETARNEQIKKLNEAYNSQLAKINSDSDALLNPLQQNLKNINEIQQRFAASEQTKKMLEQLEVAVNELEEESALMTSQLNALDTLKIAKMKNIPIPGLEIEGGQIYVDGIPFQFQNTARKIQFILSLAKLRSKDLKVICVDGMEALSADTFAAFEQAAEALSLQGYQFFVTQVSNEALEIQGAE